MSEPSTDTRAALVEELREEVGRLMLASWRGMHLDRSAAADLVRLLTDAADTLARSAPEERGEWERKGYTLVVEGDAPVVYDTPERAVAEAVRRVYLSGERHADQVQLLKHGVLAEWCYGFCSLVIYPPSKPSSPPAPVEGRDEDGYPIERGIPYPVDLSKLPHADTPTPPNAAPVEGERERGPYAHEVWDALHAAYRHGYGRGAEDESSGRFRITNAANEYMDNLPARTAALLASHPVQGAGVGERDGVALIAEERRRQVEKEGWTAQHDDLHDGNEMAHAARCYISAATRRSRYGIPHNSRAPMEWPWEDRFWKPSADPVRDLVKAGALIAAEIDRLQRAAAPAPSAPEEEPHG